jgi:hypothetical protein
MARAHCRLGVDVILHNGLMVVPIEFLSKAIVEARDIVFRAS